MDVQDMIDWYIATEEGREYARELAEIFKEVDAIVDRPDPEFAIGIAVIIGGLIGLVIAGRLIARRVRRKRAAKWLI